MSARTLRARVESPVWLSSTSPARSSHSFGWYASETVPPSWSTSAVFSATRSEERRVGKECIARGVVRAFTKTVDALDEDAQCGSIVLGAQGEPLCVGEHLTRRPQ